MSENEIKANGAPMAQTKVGLLRNLEELYLYIEELHGKIQILEKQLNNH